MRAPLTAGVFLGLIAGCADHKQIARIPAPDGSVEAVVVEGNGGATTSFWYDVYIVQPGADYSSGPDVAYTYGSLKHDREFGVDVSWKTPTDLDVAYQSAMKTSLNYSVTTVAGKQITVALRSECPESSASAVPSSRGTQADGS